MGRDASPGERIRDGAAAGGDEERFLTRWSRRKREASDGSPAGAGDAADPSTLAPAPGAATALAEPTDADMPALDTLDETSDYTGFMSPKVSQKLRRAALRKLFTSAAFNVRDGLDDYDDDFSIYEPLGDVVTADMRHQQEMEEARRRAELAETRDEDGEDDRDPTASAEAGDGAVETAGAGEADGDENEAVAAEAAGEKDRTV